MATFPTTSTERLTLDQMALTDSQAIFDIFTDPKVMHHYDMEPLNSLADAENVIAFFREKFTTNKGIRWAIRERESNQFIGTCGFNMWEPYDHSAILGYEIASNHWGKGYAREAVQQVLNLAYSGQLPVTVNRVEASVVSGNTRSDNLLIKLGFTHEGLLRQKGFWANQYHDMNLYSLLASDR